MVQIVCLTAVSGWFSKLLCWVLLGAGLQLMKLLNRFFPVSTRQDGNFVQYVNKLCLISIYPHWKPCNFSDTRDSQLHIDSFIDSITAKVASFVHSSADLVLWFRVFDIIYMSCNTLWNIIDSAIVINSLPPLSFKNLFKKRFLVN